MNATLAEMEYEVVIVGAGPAGLAAAIRLRQAAPGVSVAVVDKGLEVGCQTLPGAVIDPIALDELVPEWRDEVPDLLMPVRRDQFFWLEKNRAREVPRQVQPEILSDGNSFVGSLGGLCRYLAEKAEGDGVDVFQVFAASELLTDQSGAVVGIASGPVSIGAGRQPGKIIKAKYVLLGEGARGSLSQLAIARFGLDSSNDPQKYGLGISELWDVSPEVHQPGLVQRFIGWPLAKGSGGGGFVYHLQDRQVMVGYVVHLDYKNPFLDPHREMQRFKTHPHLRAILGSGRRVGYGAHAVCEGGYQSVPGLAFPGGALIGDSAGFANVAQAKGIHNAMLSGMLTADHVARAIKEGRGNDVLEGLDDAWRHTAIGRELSAVRNIKPLWSRFGATAAMVLGGIDMWIAQKFGRPLFGTMHHKQGDHLTMEPAKKHVSPDYPEPDHALVFDKKSSVYLSGAEYADNQPNHIKFADEKLQETSERGVYGGASAYYCPAGVFEWRKRSGHMYLTLYPQYCLHCKACDIKDPNQNITWNVPEGGDGPRVQIR